MLYASGLIRSSPLLRPVVCSSNKVRPSKVPPTLPSLARNSSITFVFQPISASSRRTHHPTLRRIRPTRPRSAPPLLAFARMEPKKRHDGYRSFSYLMEGEDFVAFDLVPELGRVEPTVVPLSDAEDARADRLLRERTCISLHDHAGIAPVGWDDSDAYIRQGREWYGFEGLAASGLDSVFENFFDGTATITSATGWKWTDVIHDVGMHLSDVAHSSVVFLGTSVADIERAHETGTIALIASIEGAAPIENELDRIDILYGLGVRMLGVTYSESNQLGGGLRDAGDRGLTDFGRRAVTRMNRIGMAIDVSHCGDVTAMQTCEASAAPVFLSHSGARALFSETKLKEDDLLRAVAETGGVIGIE